MRHAIKAARAGQEGQKAPKLMMMTLCKNPHVAFKKLNWRPLGKPPDGPPRRKDSTDKLHTATVHNGVTFCGDCREADHQRTLHDGAYTKQSSSWLRLFALRGCTCNLDWQNFPTGEDVVLAHVFGSRRGRRRCSEVGSQATGRSDCLRLLLVCLCLSIDTQGHKETTLESFPASPRPVFQVKTRTHPGPKVHAANGAR
jgi:hypothetical protein